MKKVGFEDRQNETWEESLKYVVTVMQCWRGS